MAYGSHTSFLVVVWANTILRTRTVVCVTEHSVDYLVLVAEGTQDFGREASGDDEPFRCRRAALCLRVAYVLYRKYILRLIIHHRVHWVRRAACISFSFSCFFFLFGYSGLRVSVFW